MRRVKNLAVVLANAAMAGFALAQLFSAWEYREIYFGSFGPSNWTSWTDEPFWFIAGVTLYAAAALAFTAILALSLREDWVIRRNMQRRSRQPPIDKAIRDPPNRE